MGQLLVYKCEIEPDSSRENGKTVVGSGTRRTRGTSRVRGTRGTSRARGTSKTSRVKTVDDG